MDTGSNTTEMKHCCCSLSCYRWLTKGVRDQHYTKADPMEALESDDGSNSSSLGSDMKPSTPLYELEDTAEEENELEDRAEGGDGLKETTGEGDVLEENKNALNDLKFDEDNDNKNLHLTLEEMETQFRSWLGPEIDEELYNICK
ncbi:hypothetical protein SERLA73DRAFT_149618 [Serpula lacrymans var. lacrymans S7.3]|uniref:Uncharacterized protein n=2 Tax=Serpula lacrymans var. lacrymans TaxID=341189 RepID=F8PJM4_SERL3|nr:uncharacterized protein SERLADRAFT_405174 [Serpula lacrymans var. lacrymans S7.9]EGO03225.1 hypothetical protein SERLA73DRAFT_149618 [Serpula lacrymans var. lacrymans S7.3]EGO29007.1 hypothetical protein SERLADRAFT_405174 [Serpula lacrymans var. lacrymans S7.9]